MQTMQKNHEPDSANQGEDDCSMLGLEPKRQWRNHETELVLNPQSSNCLVCDFNIQISIFVNFVFVLQPHIHILDSNQEKIYIVNNLTNPR